ncbi:MAG: nitroreductase family deazaflavin-dependent oxidoreductase [Gammaproteobacteria bacterium]|nr:nitroreductase family deazaflavin-dependent oxidoreductase [Gammaproteobacteria bacterium]
MTNKERKKWERKGPPKRLMRFITNLQAFIYKASKGKLWSTIKNSAICVVHMRGAKTGKKRAVPLMHVPYKEGVILVASLGGADVHPTWYWNLKKNPKIEVFVGSEKLNLFAEQVKDDVKSDLWPLICSCYPDFENYQKNTERNIPVFNCQP